MISGKFRKRFIYANIATMVDISAEDSEDWEIKSINGNTITLIGGGGDEFTKEIKKHKDGSEYFIVEHVGFYERAFQNGKPTKVKCEPFLDEARQHPYKPIEQPKQNIKIKIPKLKNPSEWTTKCSECGGKMEYYPNTFTYHCCKCGNVLEV